MWTDTVYISWVSWVPRSDTLLKDRKEGARDLLYFASGTNCVSWVPWAGTLPQVLQESSLTSVRGFASGMLIHSVSPGSPELAPFPRIYRESPWWESSVTLVRVFASGTQYISYKEEGEKETRMLIHSVSPEIPWAGTIYQDLQRAMVLSSHPLETIQGGLFSTPNLNNW